MQLAVLSARVPALNERDYTVTERAALLCSPDFLAHLAVWREALAAQAAGGVVPDSYLTAMRQVVASEAAAGSLDPEDALAAATAIAEIPTAAARQAAKWLLHDLASLDNPLAGVIGAALAMQQCSRASFARARLDLLALNQSPQPKTRVAALCLLGDSYLRDLGVEKMPESVAYRFYLAAAREDCPPAAPAHYRLGLWYARQAGVDTIQRANSHFEKGAEYGCTLCMAALAQLQASTDDEFALELHELSEIGDELTAGTGSRVHVAGRRGRWLARHTRRRHETFLDSVRGLLRGAFA